MANETFLDASGSTKYRKSTGAGSAGDPAVAHNILDSVTPGTAATNLGKAEDAAHTSGDVGVMALVVRKDAPVAGGADGDYVALGVNSDGRLYVTADGTVSVTGSVAVTGTFFQATQPVSIASSVAVTGPLTDAELRATAVPVSLTSTTITGTVTVTGTGGTFPVTDSGGSLTVDNAGTFAVQENGAALTALQLIDNVVLAEDAAHVSGDAGIQSLAVRNDSDTSLAGTTGDYTPLQVDSNGYLKVNIKAGAGSGGTASTDDAAFTAGSGSGTPIMGFVTSDLVDSGDVGVIGMLANRQVKVTLYDSAGAELAVGGGTQYDEDTAHVSGDKLTMAGAVRRDAATSGVSADGDRATMNVDANGLLWTVVGAALPAGTNNIGDVDVLTLPALPTGSNTIGNIGTIATSITPGTAAANLGKAEDAVHGSGDVGVMALAVQRNTAASGAADGDYATLNVNSTGRLYVDASVTVALPAGTNNIGDVDVLTVVTGTGATNLGKAEDAAHASGDTGVAIWSVRRDAAATGTSNDGDYASLNTDSTGHLWTRIGLALPAGTNNIGDVDVLTLPATPAGTNLIGQIVTRPDVSNASDGSTVLVPKFARLSTASTGNQAIVAAVSGKKIRVLSMNVMATASTNAIWINDGTADLHGTTSYKIPLDVTGATGAGGFVLPFNQLGWFETAANNRPININLGSANGITAIVTYVEV